MLPSPTAPISNPWLVSFVIFQTFSLKIHCRYTECTPLETEGSCYRSDYIIISFSHACFVQIHYTSCLFLCNKPLSRFVACNSHRFICSGFWGSALWARWGSSSAGLAWDHCTTAVSWWVAWALGEDESLLLVVLSSSRLPGLLGMAGSGPWGSAAFLGSAQE